MSQNGTGHASWIAPDPAAGAPGSDRARCSSRGLRSRHSRSSSRWPSPGAARARARRAARRRARAPSAPPAVAALALAGCSSTCCSSPVGVDDLIARNVLALWLAGRADRGRRTRRAPGRARRPARRRGAVRDRDHRRPSAVQTRSSSTSARTGAAWPACSAPRPRGSDAASHLRPALPRPAAALALRAPPRVRAPHRRAGDASSTSCRSPPRACTCAGGGPPATCRERKCRPATTSRASIRVAPALRAVHACCALVADAPTLVTPHRVVARAGHHTLRRRRAARAALSR